MAVTVTEKFESRRLTTGDNATLELTYHVVGTDSESEAKHAVLAASPAAYGSTTDPPYLCRQSVLLEPLGPMRWNATVNYDTKWPTAPSSQDSFSFETQGGTQHITQSLATVGIYAAPGYDAPYFQGAIGVSQTGVEGVDIVVPVLHFSETHHFPSISWSYRNLLATLTGTVNAGSFRGFAAGEVLFLGASGSRREDNTEFPWEVTFNFAAQPNRRHISVGNIRNISKAGWDYMWVRYAAEDDEDAGERIKRPVAVYIERVYPAADFSALGI